MNHPRAITFELITSTALFSQGLCIASISCRIAL